MKEDILEQIVDDYLNAKGLFTVHNVKFKPAESSGYSAKYDSGYSDVDVIGYSPRHEGAERTWVVSCKSWQSGFNPREKINAIEGEKKQGGREVWKGYRELVKQKWGDALVAKVEELTGSRQFTYCTAVTRLKGGEDGKTIWQDYPLFRRNLCGNPIRILTLAEMLDEVYRDMKTSLASSEVGRLLQVIKASGWKPQ